MAMLVLRCRLCGSNSYRELQKQETQKQSGGTDVASSSEGSNPCLLVQTYHLYECEGCSVVFADPGKFLESGGLD